jgi:hypothetical protein
MCNAGKSMSNNMVRRLSINERWSSIGDVIRATDAGRAAIETIVYCQAFVKKV